MQFNNKYRQLKPVNLLLLALCIWDAIQFLNSNAYL